HLNGDFNRDNDVKKRPVDGPEDLRIPPQNEDASITALFTRMSNYQQDTLDYEWWPSAESPGYNSNAFLRGLLEATPLPLLRFPTAGGANDFPGWVKPVPKVYFGVQQ